MIETETYEKSIDEVVRGLHTDLAKGLNEVEAQVRLRKYGPNELRERPRPGFFALLLNQFNNFLVIILIVAAVVTVLLGEYIDAIAITVIIVLNAVLGVFQESKAEQAIAALKKMAAPHAQVIRDGRQASIPGRELVVGDIVLLEAGNFVPADMRLVESVNLKVEEASLTGESLPAEKNAKVVLGKEIPLGDRKNAVFMSTLITYGRGRGIVTGTGMDTQIGLIAEMIQSYVEEDTPLQQKLAHLGKVLGTACLAICGFVFIFGLLRDTNLASVFHDGFINYLLAEQKVIVGLFMIAVSLAIAAVPEGLPAIVTICLALGMQQMIKRHALIRKLAAVETLGSTTVICTDKTGTLTQNQMTVLQGWTGGKGFHVTGEGYAPAGLFTRDGQEFAPQGDADVAALLRGGLLCNDADLVEGGKETSWGIIGDPTEGALVVAAAKAGVRRADMVKVLPRVAEIPFDSDRKRMTTIHRLDPTAARTGTPGGFSYPPVVAFVKGAPDFVLDLCSRVLQDGQVIPLTEEKRQGVIERNREMAGDALRVLAVTYRPLDAVPENPDPDQVEKDLTFIGLLGMIDPPRPEVIAAIRLAQGAGLKTVMVTGDYRDTAEAVAREVGLKTSSGLVLTGTELDQMSDERLTEEANRLEVCCRVSPAHKMRIVDAMKARGHIVAMTGDGVNDAPALKRADIGIAMGITGTDVSKEAADMVLTDDNFSSIVSAVEQGRIIYSNIRKFVYFLLACNVGEIMIVFGAMLIGLPIPLRPIHLLWLNLISDGAPALALGMEKGEPDTMTQPPRRPAEPLVNVDMTIGISVVAVTDAIAILLVFYLGMGRYPGQIEAAQTMAFVTLSLSELVRAFTARSEYLSVFKIGVFSNRWMVGATAVSFLFVLTVVYVPFLQPFFNTVTLTPDDWLFMLPFFFASPIAMELIKIYIRHKRTTMLSANGGIAKTKLSQKEV
ncbi:MAG: cation-translocating P-type ATPase [Syntrophales bacterium]|jgi:Ca2+-transporting ATPase|nr:cation-translocating P-type ATPase [Syntrophales bacterium]